MASSTFCTAPLALAVLLGVSGCSNVPVRFVGDAEKAKAARANMPQAMQYLEDVRGSYRKAVEEQMAGERTATNALLGGGALMLALALGGAHRDAMAGTALVAGTGYTLANVNLPRQHVLVRLAGVDALTCAERAIAPLEVAGAQLTKLEPALDALADARVHLTAAMNRGRVLPRAAQDPASEGAALNAAIQLGEQAHRDSADTLRAGRALVQQSGLAARELVAAVNGIDDAVVRSLVSATPDLAAVPGLISGLASLSSSFVPPSGTRDLLRGTSAQAAGGAKSTGGLVQTEVAKATQAILGLVQEVATHDADVRSLMPERAASWPDGALKHCGVANVVTAMTASAKTLTFTTGADARRTMVVQGGVKPYVVQVEGTPIEGLQVQPPRPFDNQVVVQATGKQLAKPGTLQLRIFDSSPNGSTPVEVDVVVAAADVPQKAAAGKTPDKAKTTVIKAESGGDALGRIKAKGTFAIGGKPFAVTEVPTQAADGTISVRVQCPAGATQTHAQLVTAILTNAGVTATPLPKLQVRTDPATCLTPTP